MLYVLAVSISIKSVEVLKSTVYCPNPLIEKMRLNKIAIDVFIVYIFGLKNKLSRGVKLAANSNIRT